MRDHLIRRPFGFMVAVGLLWVLLQPVFAAPGEQIRRPRPDPGTSRQDAGSLVVWQDREFRTSYVPERDETEMWLAVQPVDPTSNLSRLTMVFGARLKGRSPSVPPGHVEIRLILNPLLDPRFARVPRLTLFLNPDTEESEQLDLSGIFATAGYLVNPTGTLLPSGSRVNPTVIPPPAALAPDLLVGVPRAGGPPIDGSLAPDPSAASSVETVLFALPVGIQFLHVLNAEEVQGQAVGLLDFSFSEAQLNALRDFANRILLPSGTSRGRVSGSLRIRER